MNRMFRFIFFFTVLNIKKGKRVRRDKMEVTCRETEKKGSEGNEIQEHMVPGAEVSTEDDGGLITRSQEQKIA